MSHFVGHDVSPLALYSRATITCTTSLVTNKCQQNASVFSQEGIGDTALRLIKYHTMKTHGGGGWLCSSSIHVTSALDEVSAQLRALATLPQGRSPRYPLDREDEWAPEPMWTLQRNPLPLSGIDPRLFSLQPVAIPTTLPRLLMLTTNQFFPSATLTGLSCTEDADELPSAITATEFLNTAWINCMLRRVKLIRPSPQLRDCDSEVWDHRVFAAARWYGPSSLSPEGGGTSSAYNHFCGSETEHNNLLLQNVSRFTQIA